MGQIKNTVMGLGFLLALLVFTPTVMAQEVESDYVCREIDFDTYPDGTPVAEGDFLNQSYADWGVELIIGFDPADALMSIALDTEDTACGNTGFVTNNEGMMLVVQDKLSNCYPQAEDSPHAIGISFDVDEEFYPTYMVLFNLADTVEFSMTLDSALVASQSIASAGVGEPAFVNLSGLVQADRIVLDSGGGFAIKEIGFCTETASPTSVGLGTFQQAPNPPAKQALIVLATVVLLLIFLTIAYLWWVRRGK